MAHSVREQNKVSVFMLESPLPYSFQFPFLLLLRFLSFPLCLSLSPSLPLPPSPTHTFISPCLPLYVQYLSPNAIAVRTPQSPRPGEVDITLVFKGTQFCIANPGKFLYMCKSTANSHNNNYLSTCIGCVGANIPLHTRGS